MGRRTMCSSDEATSPRISLAAIVVDRIFYRPEGLKTEALRVHRTSTPQRFKTALLPALPPSGIVGQLSRAAAAHLSPGESTHRRRTPSSDRSNKNTMRASKRARHVRVACTVCASKCDVEEAMRHPILDVVCCGTCHRCDQRGKRPLSLASASSRTDTRATLA